MIFVLSIRFKAVASSFVYLFLYIFCLAYCILYLLSMFSVLQLYKSTGHMLNWVLILVCMILFYLVVMFSVKCCLLFARST